MGMKEYDKIKRERRVRRGTRWVSVEVSTRQKSESERTGEIGRNVSDDDGLGADGGLEVEGRLVKEQKKRVKPSHGDAEAREG